jgi:hypothetical protein
VEKRKGTRPRKTAMKFDPDKDFQKQSRYGKSAIYIQDGCKFDAGYKYIGRVADPTDTPEKRKADQQTVRDRAKEKLGKLKGFTVEDKPDAVKQALNENQAAREAEELVE